MYVALVSQANTKIFQQSPTLASGDFKTALDGGTSGNLGTLPTNTPGAAYVKITLSTSEMNGANASVMCVDAAGTEWCDLFSNVPTAARQIDDLAFPATSGRSIVTSSAGVVDAQTVSVGPTTSGTAQTARDLGLALPAAGPGAANGLTICGNNAATTFATFTSTGTFLVNAFTCTNNFLTSGNMTVTGTTTLTGAVTASNASNDIRVDVRTIKGAASAGAAGYVGIDWSAVNAPTTTLALTGTTIAVTQKVDVDTIKTNPVVNGGTLTFPSGATLASTTNITGGTITTVTNLTNAATAGDFTSTMKTSLNAATPASVVGAVGSVTGLTVATIATGVWQDATAGDFTTASSIGKSLYNSFTANTSVFTTAALANAPGGTLTAAAIWDLVYSGHTTAGTFGALALASGSAADPWLTLLPGSYGAGTAGFYIGTDIPAIKLKTDLIVANDITVQSPVSADGTTITIIAGDSYKAADGRAITITSSDWPSLIGATVTLRLAGLFNYTFTVASATSVTRDFTSAETQILSARTYDFVLHAVLSDGDALTLTSGTQAAGTGFIVLANIPAAP